MTKLDKELLHNFGNTYHALASAQVPHSTKVQLVNDLWDKIQAEIPAEKAKETPKAPEMPSPPCGTSTFRIYFRPSNTLWSTKHFLTYAAARENLLNHYSETSNRLTANTSAHNYWGLNYEIREEFH
ncbi:hypothetical protein PBI_MIMI_48 [Arthrobacter phage Mimi]|nr:hypothetical protein PBI_MIMI_128 [Arthrobacter phage Mimi]